jgi:hypothetical protein
MKLNIIQTLKEIYTNKIQLMEVYFTTLPSVLYKMGINNGNFALCGIGLGLIYSKRLFWICNLSIATLYYYKQYANIYFYYLFVSVSLFLIIKSLLISVYLVKYMKDPDIYPEN